MVINYIVDFAVNTTVDRVNQTIALTTTGILEERCCENAFPLRRKSNIHWIIHPTRHHGFYDSALSPAAKNMRGAGPKGDRIRALILLFGKCAFAPIDPAIQPAVWPV